MRKRKFNIGDRVSWQCEGRTWYGEVSGYPDQRGYPLYVEDDDRGVWNLHPQKLILINVNREELHECTDYDS